MRQQVITLPKWKTALGSSASSIASAVFLGTSTIQGANATDIDRRYHQIISNELSRTYNGSKYVRYYSPQADLVNTYTSFFTYTDGTGSHVLVSEGLSLRTVTLTNGAKTAITLTASAVSVLFVQGSAYGQGTVDVDGSSTLWPSDPRSGDHHDGVYSVTGLSNASHTVTITAPVSGSIKFTGLAAHGYASGDVTKGVYFYNSGHGGFTTTDFVGQTYLFDRIASINPQLVALMFGTNDYGSNIPLSTYQANLSSIISSIKALVPNADILIVSPYKRLDLFPAIPWTSYTAINKNIASTFNCPYVDLTSFYPSSTSFNYPTIIDTDNLHQTDLGHSYMAKLLFPVFT